MNSEYWEKRLADVVWNSYNTLEEQNIALLDHYNKTMNKIRAELVKIEEQKTLTRSDKYRVQHLKSIQEQILKECEKLGDSVENDMIGNVSKMMQNIYKAAFSNISNDKFSRLSKNTCKDIINTPWKGSSFSERLWNNTGKLANELNDILASGITEGKTIAEMAFQLSNRMHSDMNICHRLVRTETINSLNRASMRGMMDAGVGYVRWWAAQDERECDECGANHGKIYPIDRAPNLPCHPGCRCTWLPVLDDELNKEELRMLDTTGNELYNYVKSSKIESVKSNEELKKIFTYKDKFGREHNPFDKSFNTFSIDVQKEICEGILYVQKNYNLDDLPVLFNKKNMKAWGKITTNDQGVLKIELADKLNRNMKEVFPTIIHELIHFINHRNLDISMEIVKKAKINLKLNKKEYSKYVYELIASNDYSYLNSSSELLSFSIEREATGKGNKLSKEIDRILREELKK